MPVYVNLLLTRISSNELSLHNLQCPNILNEGVRQLLLLSAPELLWSKNTAEDGSSFAEELQALIFKFATD